MRSTFKILMYLKKDSEKPNGNVPLMCRLTVDGEIKQFSCKIEIYPKLSENLRIAQLCKGVGLVIDTIKQLFTNEAVLFTGKLHSPEHDHDFSVQEAKLQIFKEQDTPDKFRLSLNGQNIIDWFKQKYQEVKQTIRPHIKPPAKSEVDKNKGFKR